MNFPESFFITIVPCKGCPVVSLTGGAWRILYRKREFFRKNPPGLPDFDFFAASLLVFCSFRLILNQYFAEPVQLRGRGMRVTLKDIAARAGVSKSLVSMYLNGNPAARLQPETRERIDRAIAELGYRPSFAAQALAQGRTKMIGFVVGGVRDPYFSGMIDVILIPPTAAATS